jgi:hypothetical protein
MLAMLAYLLVPIEIVARHKLQFPLREVGQDCKRTGLLEILVRLLLLLVGAQTLSSPMRPAERNSQVDRTNLQI